VLDCAEVHAAVGAVINTNSIKAHLTAKLGVGVS
jgi:hypothetical protein